MSLGALTISALDRCHGGVWWSYTIHLQYSTDIIFVELSSSVPAQGLHVTQVLPKLYVLFETEQQRGFRAGKGNASLQLLDVVQYRIHAPAADNRLSALRCTVLRLGFRVQGLGCRVQGMGFGPAMHRFASRV